MSTVDFAVAVVMILSTLLAVLRGFTREVLTIVAWLGAILAVVYGLPLFHPLLKGLFEDETTGRIAGGAFLGLVTLVILSLISHQIGKAVKKHGLGPVDRTLGGLFGAARGALLLCLFYMLTVYAYGADTPDWLKDALVQPVLAKGAEKVETVLPKEWKDKIMPKDDKKDDSASGKIGDKSDKTEIPPEKPVGPEHGYENKERGDMDKLIEKNEPGVSGKHDATP